MSKLERAKDISCDSILSECGFDAQQTSGGRNYYYSPWRSEGKPSLVVYTNSNRWSDYGQDPRSKDSIDLYMQIHSFQEGQEGEAIAKMLNEEYTVFERKDFIRKPGVVVVGIDELKSDVLRDYLLSKRGIPFEIAKLYCKELKVKFPEGQDPNRVHKVVGFQNSLEGYEFRNEYQKKGTSPKSYTLIKGDGESCIAFEGWIDFLTFLVIKGVEAVKSDVFVYNSTSFFEVSVPILKKYSKVSCFFDNDDAGNKLYKDLKNKGIWVKDYSSMYSGSNDLNSFYTDKLGINN